jgi:hypothetical protein
MAQFKIFQPALQRIKLADGVEQEWKSIARHTSVRTGNAKRLLIVHDGICQIANGKKMTTAGLLCG